MKRWLLIFSTIFPVVSYASLVPLHEEVSQLKKQVKPAQIIQNWGLFNTEANSHIDILRAHEITKGSKTIKVAIIDTGCDSNHKMIKNNVMSYKGGFGWDYVRNSSKPIDRHGHGSHVTGIVTATAPGVSVLCIRYYSETASGAENLRNTIKAFNLAIDAGVDIINYSGGGAEFSAEEFAAVKRAQQKGILFVAAAGNESNDIDKEGKKYFPGAYQLDNIITVAATDIRNNKIASSNWGLTNVDVAAPGNNIHSSMHNGQYGYLTGTSQATAFVTGLAALIKSANPSLTYTDIKDIIMASVDKVPGLKNKVASGGKINAYTALRTVLAMKETDGNNLVATHEFSQKERAAKDSAQVKRKVADAEKK